MIGTPNGKPTNEEPMVANNFNENGNNGSNGEDGFFDIAAEDDSPEKILSQIVIYEPNHLDERHYKRMGFFCAVGEVADPEA